MYNDARRGRPSSNRFGDYDDDNSLFMGASTSTSSRGGAAESYGFQKMIDGSASVFESKRMKIGLIDEIMRQLQITERQLVLITESGKLFRQQYDEYTELKEVELPAMSSGGMFYLFNSKVSFESIDKFYLDETGTHCLLASKTTDSMYYWHYADPKVKTTIGKFPKDPSNITFAIATDSEVTFLVATRSRELYYAKISRSKKTNEIESSFTIIDVQLPKNPISSISIYTTDCKASSYTCVLLCDDQTFNYYYDECAFPNVFKKYERNKSNVEEIPFNPPGKISICMARRLGDHRPHSFLYTTGSTLISLMLPSSQEIPSDSFLKNSNFMKYAKSISENDQTQELFIIEENGVKQIGLTEFHYFLVYEDCVTIMSRLTGKVVETFDLNSMQGSVIDMFYDNSGGQRSMIIYSRKQIMKIVINNEEQHACFNYIKAKNQQAALELAKRTHITDMIPYISGLYGDLLFEEKKFVAASKNYVNSNRSFEEVMLKFMKTNQSESAYGLIDYLQMIAKRLRKSNKVQNRIIEGLSLEYFNYQINTLEKQLEVVKFEESNPFNESHPLEDWSYKIQFSQPILKKQSVILSEKLNQFRDVQAAFMSAKWDAIFASGNSPAATGSAASSGNPSRSAHGAGAGTMGDTEEIRQSEVAADQKLAYEIMQNHGRLNDCLDFAKQRRNYENVITHYVNEQNFKNAIGYLRTLSKESDSKRATEIAYKFAYILVQREPELFFQLIMDHVRDFQPTKLISALMNIPDKSTTAAINFLEHCIFSLEKTDTILHNLYLFFLANQFKSHQAENSSLSSINPHQKILDYLTAAEELAALSDIKDRQSYIRFDLDFALQLFEDNDIVDAKVKTYALMNFYDLAVKLALDKNNLALAKEYASKHPQDSQKQKLWLRIAVHMIEQRQSESVLQLTSDSKSYLKVEDLLPFFSEVHQIDLLKDQICQNLKKYNDDIGDLKTEVDSLTTMSDSLKRHINTHSHNYLILKGKHHCHFCNKTLLKSDHYLFSCLHGFHRNCLVSAMKTDSSAPPSKPFMETQANHEIDDDLSLTAAGTSSNKRLKRIIALNQFLNQADADLKLKQEEALHAMKAQLLEESQINSSAASSVSKFFKSIGGAFAQKKDDQINANQQLADGIKSKIEKLNIQEIVANVLSKEERDRVQRKQLQIDEFLQKECYVCGLEAVDRVHSEYPIKQEQEWSIS